MPPSAAQRRVDAGVLAAVTASPAFPDVADAAPAAWRQPLLDLEALGARCAARRATCRAIRRRRASTRASR
ncbi:hypothetical protein WL38_25895 [Burkholderia ubonensis]|nr:hypothetical protein WK76_23810 [Burkholderia ubonensis]KWB61276.1 hypothetical protein WL38_25895 [Burkholderia ubonensis]